MTASIFGLITFILGGFAGFAIYHYFFRASNQEKKLMQELHQVQADFREYHEKVAQNLTESVAFTDQLQALSLKLHDHILNATVVLNRSQHKQSILQPVLHPEFSDDEEHEQVTEYHPAPDVPKKGIVPPKDYV